MDRTLFNIARVETTKNSIIGRSYVSVAFVVQFKGIEINRFSTIEAAEDCVTDAASLRSDAQWAFEDALREAGYDIPRD